ncbi:hypothetical protein LguiA_019733 [Lonicera macranthoides]
MPISLSLSAVATVSSLLSFPIVAQFLNELNMVNSQFGRMAFPSSLVTYYSFLSLHL